MNGYLEKYCKLIVTKGLNVQKGQKVLINSPVDCVEFTRVVTEEAYKAGASEVFISWSDEKIGRLKFDYAEKSVFEKFPPWTKLMMNSLAKEGAAFLSVASADPENLKGVDPEKIIAAMKASTKALKQQREVTMSNKTQWCVASVPNEKWAAKVFPKAGKKAYEKLWEAIYSASRVDEGDAVQNWEAHTAAMKKRIDILNKHKFKSMIYTNSLGTNLEVGLPEGHIWCGGVSNTNRGTDFSPNIPSEEIFSAPHRDMTEGVVYGTKPLVYSGNVIDDFAFYFKNGRIVKVESKSNQELLEKLVSTLKNMDMLGEIALVEYNSPISQSGLIFYNTLFDENASCHFAVGRAYTPCVKDAVGKSDKELEQMGINCSDGHHDFMVGSADLQIVGIKKDGKKVVVFKDGNFAF